MEKHSMMKKMKITFLNFLIHVKNKGICLETIKGDKSNGDILGLIDEVRGYCEEYNIQNITEMYMDPEMLKERINEKIFEKLWWDILKSKKAPISERTFKKKMPEYATKSKLESKLLLLWQCGELGFRASKRHESLRRFGSISCLLNICDENDTLAHCQVCVGYTSRPVNDGSEESWSKYLLNLEAERVSKYGSSASLINFRR